MDAVARISLKAIWQTLKLSQIHTELKTMSLSRGSAGWLAVGVKDGETGIEVQYC